MGLKNGKLVLQFLRKAAPSAFARAVDPKVGYSTIAVDLMSLMHSLFYTARDGFTLRLRLRDMLRQHKACSEKSAEKKLVSIFAIEDYARTPKNKEIERDARSKSSDSLPYAEKVEVWLATSQTNADGAYIDSETIDIDKYELNSLESRLPRDFSRARATPRLMRWMMRFLCRLIADNVDFLLDNDPNHLLIVDGFRDYGKLSRDDNENAPNSDAAKHVDTWRSDTREMFNGSIIGEGEVKATSWAVNYHSAGNVLVHANDSDLIALLAIYSARVPHESTITGVMSQSYMFPLDAQTHPAEDGQTAAGENDDGKVFDSMKLAVGIFQTINQSEEKGLVLPQTYFLFMFMCGNDYVDQLYRVGPAKLMTALASRRAGLLEKAVVFCAEETRINLEVDEKVVIQTLFMAAGNELEKYGETPEKIAAWLRRVIWTLDYNINAPLGYNFLDPCEQRHGKSVHGYTLNDSGRCVKTDVVWQPTIVRFTLASERYKRTACAFEPPPETLRVIEEEETVLMQSHQQLKKKIKIEEGHETHRSQSFAELMMSMKPESTARSAYLMTIRQPVPFGETPKQ